MVKELRERTGAGMMDCKRALQEAGGDEERAIDILRKSGAAKAAKRAGRDTAEGLVVIARDEGSGAVAMVEVSSETDFVARNQEFMAFARRAAETALAYGGDGEPRPGVELLDHPEEIYRAQAEKEGKPPEIAARIVEGRMRKFFEGTALLWQPFVKDPDRKVSALVEEAGPDVRVRRFIRFAVGG
jgi:elongation factor Ts